MLLHPWITLALGERDTNSDSLCLVVHATNISTQHRSVLAILIDRFVRDQITCLLTPTSGRGRSLGQMIGAGAAAKCWMNVRARDCEWTYFTKSPSRRRHGGGVWNKKWLRKFHYKKVLQGRRAKPKMRLLLWWEMAKILGENCGVGRICVATVAWKLRKR